jgi:transposase
MALEVRIRELEAQLERVTHERDEYRKLYELVSLELERFRRHLFGQKAERVDAAQTPSATEPTAGGDAVPNAGPSGGAGVPGAPLRNRSAERRARRDAERKPGKTTPHGRQKLPEHLPIERVELLPAEALGEDATAYVRIGEEVTETIEWRSAGWVRWQVVRPKFARRATPEQGIAIAELPEHPIPRCLAGPGLLAHVLVNKYADHLPLNRQEKIFERHGIHLARSTLCGWVASCAELLGYIVAAMAKDALSAHCIATDATGVLVQAKEQCRRGHFWVLVADRDHVLFRFTPRHTKDGPKDFLRGYKGYVQADASSVYEALYRTEQVVEVGCWAHCRRNFYEALASDRELALAAISFIRELFVIDVATVDLPPSQRTEERRARSEPVLARFRVWLEAQSTLVLPKSPIAGAIGYTFNQWTALTRFLEDGRLKLDNNRSERELRRQATGRKNWLFVGTDDGAEWNATVVSLIASCALHAIEPWSYLRDALILLPSWPRDRVLELSPKHWKQTLENTDARQRLAASPWCRASAPSAS